METRPIHSWLNGSIYQKGVYTHLFFRGVTISSNVHMKNCNLTKVSVVNSKYTASVYNLYNSVFIKNNNTLNLNFRQIVFEFQQVLFKCFFNQL